MRVVSRFIAIAGLAFCGLLQQASAAMLYDNGPINGTISHRNIDFGWAVSDSFTLLQASTLTGVTFGAWSAPGTAITSVDWGITTTPATYTVSGTAAVTSGPQTPALGGYATSTDSFSLPGISLAAGTYYLVLQNAVSASSSYWDVTNGGSSATQYNTLTTLDNGSIASESFQILGDANTTITPLPAALPLFATGLGALGLLGWRRKRKAAALAA